VRQCAIGAGAEWAGRHHSLPPSHCSPWCKKRGGFWRGNFKK
jgi:hypothetical protein